MTADSYNEDASAAAGGSSTATTKEDTMRFIFRMLKIRLPRLTDLADFTDHEYHV